MLQPGIPAGVYSELDGTGVSVGIGWGPHKSMVWWLEGPQSASVRELAFAATLAESWREDHADWLRSTGFGFFPANGIAHCR